jgi:hypothetical protein
MSLANIRTQLKSILETVPGIGKVHDFERWTNDWKSFLSNFKTEDNKINGWVITRTSATERLRAVSAVNTRTHKLVIKGYYGLKDSKESEKAFQDLIEAICNALRVNNDLNRSCLRSDPPQLVRVLHGKYAGILVHLCQIHLLVDEYIQY